jgi:hypothetical protein
MRRRVVIRQSHLKSHNVSTNSNRSSLTESYMVCLKPISCSALLIKTLKKTRKPHWTTWCCGRTRLKRKTVWYKDSAWKFMKTNPKHVQYYFDMCSMKLFLAAHNIHIFSLFFFFLRSWIKKSPFKKKCSSCDDLKGKPRELRGRKQLSIEFFFFKQKSLNCFVGYKKRFSEFDWVWNNFFKICSSNISL